MTTKADWEFRAEHLSDQAQLREMGVPEDMNADDVKAFFSLPDDDDRMHQPSNEGPGRRCVHGKLFSESCPGCGYVHPRDR